MSLLFQHQFLGPSPNGGGNVKNWEAFKIYALLALLRYPSVPLPVFFNPFIPADWRRGGEHSCFNVDLNSSQGMGAR